MRNIFVTFDVVGFHQWPGATGRRAYLADRHRHKFHFRVEMPVAHCEREVEFHDLLDDARCRVLRMAPNGEFGGQSCESIAEGLLRYLVATYRRPVVVTVSEDNEVGAIVSGDPQTCGLEGRENSVGA